MYIACERREYVKKRECAALDLSKFMPFIIDGADQSVFELPHFITETKDMHALSLKVMLIGVLEHGFKTKLSFFIMTECHETGDKHIIETMHQVLTIKMELSVTPKYVFVQMDICTCENKIPFVFSYFESLVPCGIEKEIILPFLPIGHTPEDIDQAFSCPPDAFKPVMQ